MQPTSLVLDYLLVAFERLPASFFSQYALMLRPDALAAARMVLLASGVTRRTICLRVAI